MLSPVWRTGRYAAALLFLLLLLWRGWGAWQSNRAFLALSHQPSLFTSEAGAAIPAGTAAQLAAVLQRHPDRPSAQRMLAVVQRAQGEEAPAGVTPTDLLWWGQQKQRAGETAEAAYLLQWATDLAPDLGDGWYYLGQAHETQQDWAMAEQAYEQAARAMTWQQGGRSDAYLAWGNLLRATRPETHSDIAREHYEQALALDQFSDVAQQAATHYQLGEIVLWHDGDPAGAIPYYQAALALAPGEHWARLRLGYALYWSSGDVAPAEQEILAAIDQWPGEAHLKWPYFYLGEIYEHAGHTAQAIAAYERLLALDPDDQRVQERLDALRSR